MAVELVRELREIFARERMLAFCDVKLPLPGAPTGILRINRPHDSGRTGHYLALLFLVDAESEQHRHEIERWLASVSWADWPNRLKAIDMVIDMPNAESPPGLVQKQVDVYLRPDVALGSPETVAGVHRTLPALSRIEVGDLVAWEEVASPSPGSATDAGSTGILGRLAGLLKRARS